MKVRKMQCPNCKANLHLDPNLKTGFCQYCGTKLMIDDEVKRSEHTYRKIDEARIKESDNDRDIELERMKFKEREDRRSLFAAFAAILLFVAIEAAIFWALGANKREATKNGLISAGSYKDYEKKDYETVIEQIEAKGFTNIKTIDLDDSFLLINKEGTVESISIGGDSEFSSDDYFDPSDKVVISYH